MKNLFLLLVIFLFSLSSGFAQSLEQDSEVVEEENVEENLEDLEFADLEWVDGSNEEQSLSTAAVPLRPRAEALATKELDKLSSYLTLSETKKQLLQQVFIDLFVKEIRIEENSSFSKSKKNLQKLNLKFEKKNRIKLILEKEQFKLYRQKQKEEQKAKKNHK